jgi:hypothetical protein
VGESIDQQARAFTASGSESLFSALDGSGVVLTEPNPKDILSEQHRGDGVRLNRWRRKLPLMTPARAEMAAQDFFWSFYEHILSAGAITNCVYFLRTTPHATRAPELPDGSVT